MKLIRPHERIYLFLGNSPTDLGKPFVRLQEFYESPSKRFRRNIFSLEDFKKWYCRYQNPDGKFTYYRDFYGYNVPGKIVNDFFFLYSQQLTNEEMDLLKMLDDIKDNHFYVIGSPEDSIATIDHELSHAFFYLFPEYSKKMMDLHKEHDLAGIRKYLRENMYSKDMYNDEITSYVMFDWPLMNRAGTKTRHLKKLRSDMREVYEDYKTRFISL